MNTRNNNINNKVSKARLRRQIRAKNRRIAQLQRQRRRRIKIARRRRNRNSIPIATAQNFTRSMYNTNITNTTARVSGSDLVYKIPDTLPMTADTTVIAVIPANPAYWLGTKVATIARGYQNYRPVKFDVHYKPHCAATQAGNVIAGTIYHEAPSTDNLQQSLKTSNGGIMTQVFKPAVSHVKVGTNLQKNLYRVGGDIDDDSMPFYYLAIAIACKDINNNRINPGYFYVDYTFIFKNPIGGSQQYSNSGITKFTSQLTTMKRQNAVAILCEPLISSNTTLSIGTTLDIEYNTDNQSWSFYYNGTEVQSPNVYMWVLSNDQGTALTQSQMQAQTKLPILYTLETPYTEQDTITVGPYQAVAYTYNSLINTFSNTTNEDQYLVINAPIESYYSLSTADQNLGTYENISDPTFMYFAAPMLRYFLKSVASTFYRQTQFHKITTNVDRFRNAQAYGKTDVSVPHSNYTITILSFLQDDDSIDQQHSSPIDVIDDQMQQLHITDCKEDQKEKEKEKQPPDN